MISCIICSRTKDISTELRNNIDSTVGCDHEIVVIDNSQNEYSIFSAYNEGVRRSKGDILCFMHEDIMFRTENWGHVLYCHFNSDDKIGLIGVAGTHYMPPVPAYWLDTIFISEHTYCNDKGVREERHLDSFWRGENLIEAVACDGLCLFVKRSMFDRVGFDDSTYNGFHFYDMDICMQIIQSGFKVCICNDLLVEHYWSESEHMNSQSNRMFDKNKLLFYTKWKEYFPIRRGIDYIPQDVINRINNIQVELYNARMVRYSWKYKVGNYLLTPLFKLLKPT